MMQNNIKMTETLAYVHDLYSSESSYVPNITLGSKIYASLFFGREYIASTFEGIRVKTLSSGNTILNFDNLCN